MDRERILEKSRKENKNQDEMERQIRVEGESFSVLITMLVGIFLLAWKFAHGEEYHDILAMFWCTSTGCALYRWVIRGQKSQIWIFAVSLALLIYNLVKYLIGA